MPKLLVENTITANSRNCGVKGRENGKFLQMHLAVKKELMRKSGNCRKIPRCLKLKQR